MSMRDFDSDSRSVEREMAQKARAQHIAKSLCVPLRTSLRQTESGPPCEAAGSASAAGCRHPSASNLETQQEAAA